MNRRSFFGIFALPIVAIPVKAEGQPPHVVNNSARVMLQRVNSMTITIGPSAYSWPAGKRY